MRRKSDRQLDREFRLEIAEADCPQSRALATNLDGVTDQEINAAAEVSYRRGFDQGVAAALEAMEKGITLMKLQRWKRRIERWRRKRHHGRIEYPEWVARRQGASAS